MKTPAVLVIDPDPKELEKTSRVLTDARHTVLKASDCDEASGIIAGRRGRVVVLSELEVKGKNGLEFMKETLRKYPFLPFSFLSASPPLNSVLGALRQGAYDFLRKPAPPDILCHSVSRAIQRLDLMLESEKQEKEIRRLLARSKADLKDAQTLSSFKGFMISMAAHDFRSVVTVLDGYVQFIREKCRGCEVTEPAGIAYQASRTIGRLRAMANTLLDYESAETGRISLDVRPFPLDEMLEECVSFYGPYADQKQIRLSLDGEDRGIVVLGDRNKVMEILDNLLFNALKFTPANGSIQLSGTMEDGQAVISVSDSGAGIPKERLRKIFDPAGMVATLDANARLGLGMTICKRLIEAQKGKISIESTLGKGTKVSFSLPSGK